jgi:hypothetical protein
MRGYKIPIQSRIPHHLDASLLRRASRHMQQQCWLWGCDVRHNDGNLLLEYGFARYRPDNPLAGSSLYVHTTATHSVMLWGFGMYVGDVEHGGAFIFRHLFDPVAVSHPSAQIFTPEAVTHAACAPQAIHQHYLLTALSWITAYEDWVIKRMGMSYRHQSIGNWPKKSLQTEYTTFVADWHQCAHAMAYAPDIHTNSPT